jgi:hypothetical protein
LRLRRSKKNAHAEQDQTQLDAIRREWADELRIAAVEEPGMIVIGMRYGTDEWAEIDIGTGDAEDVMLMLAAALAEAQVRLDQAVSDERRRTNT